MCQFANTPLKVRCRPQRPHSKRWGTACGLEHELQHGDIIAGRPFVRKAAPSAKASPPSSGSSHELGQERLLRAREATLGALIEGDRTGAAQTSNAPRSLPPAIAGSQARGSETSMVGSSFSARGAAVACAVLNRRADSEVRNGAMNKRHSGCLGGGVKPSYWTCGLPNARPAAAHIAETPPR